MNEENLQEQNMMPVDNQMTPEEAKAALGLSTRLSEQFLMQQMAQEQAMMGEEAPVEGEMPQGGEETPQVEETPQIDTEALKKEILGEVKDMVKEEMSGLKEQIQEALDEDEKD